MVGEYFVIKLELEKCRWQKEILQRFRGETCEAKTTKRERERNRELCILNAKEGFTVGVSIRVSMSTSCHIEIGVFN